MIAFGVRSLTLLVAAANGLVLAALLWTARTNRTPNRLLAALLLVFVLRIVPYVIGYAGFYDAYPWLSFAPYDFSLAFGPLLWLYTRALTTGALPRRWGVHFIPAALQLLYYAVVFRWPLADKNLWDERVHEPLVAPVQSALTWVGIAAYLAFAARDYRALQRRLDAHLSNREEFRLAWLPRVLVAIGVTLLLWIAFAATSAFITRLDYFDLFPMYLWWAALVYYLGLGGWRHASLTIPSLPPLPVPVSIPTAVDVPHAPEAPEAPGEPVGAELAGRVRGKPTDWRELGERYAKETEAAALWRDPDLSLSALARALATNTSYLSRALNEGLGESFNGFVNRLRVEAVKRELASGSTRDVLAIGLDAGFRSKASFNRAFKEVTGTTPTAYRGRAGVRTTGPDESPHSPEGTKGVSSDEKSLPGTDLR